LSFVSRIPDVVLRGRQSTHSTGVRVCFSSVAVVVVVVVVLVVVDSTTKTTTTTTTTSGVCSVYFSWCVFSSSLSLHFKIALRGIPTTCLRVRIIVEPLELGSRTARGRYIHYHSDQTTGGQSSVLLLKCRPLEHKNNYSHVLDGRTAFYHQASS